MHLTSVTLRGFKSFADRTRLDLDPGLIAVVGPNGAGKSNLIDALLWALGTQGTRALRAERMEDVIFTGTNSRQQLGMSQVILTFDNSTQTFPLDFSEVSVGRTLFRDGASEYALNGASCRLLDVQELLAEAGIGREMHVVVAQGQVEDIVQAKPEELRGYVEEAAGISKHRRRKERTLRKIEQVDLDISRASDVLGEIRRQLRPLEAQVARAQAHQELTDRLREIRIRLAVAELDALDTQRRTAQTDKETLAGRVAELRRHLEQARSTRSETERLLADTRSRAGSVRRGLDALRNAQAAAFRAVVVLRERVNAQPDLRRAENARTKLEALDAEEAGVRQSLEALQQDLDAREADGRRLREERAGAQAAAVEAAERLQSLRSMLSSTQVEIRAAEQAEVTARAEARAAQDRYERAAERIARLEQSVDGIRAEIERFDAEAGRAGMTVERLESERRDAAAAVEDADRRLRGVESQLAVVGGRIESLRVARDLAAARRVAAEEFKAGTGELLGSHGILADLVRVAPGLERAVEAVLGQAVDAVVVPGGKLAEAVERAEAEDRDLLVAPTVTAGAAFARIPGTRRLSEAVEAPGFLRGTVDALLDGVFVVEKPDEAGELATRYPHATFVTTDGRIVRARGISAPAVKKPVTIGIAESLAQAEEQKRRFEADQSRFAGSKEKKRAEVERIEGELEEARSQLHEIEGRIAAAADRMRELSAESHAAGLERELADDEHRQKLTRAEESASRAATLRDEAVALEGQVGEAAEAAVRADESVAQAAQAAQDVELATTELLTQRAELGERLRGIERSRDEAREEIAAADVVPADPQDLQAAESVLAATEQLVSGVGSQVKELFEAEEAADAELRRVTAEAGRAEVDLAALEPRSLSSAETIARLDSRIEEIGSRLARDHGVPPGQARREFPPDRDVESLRAEEAQTDSQLRKIGPVNPLASQEIVELQERKEFLEGQLEDLRTSRRDLLRLVRAAEDKMRELLVAAVDDADARFRDVAGHLFPEGDGRLRLVPGPNGDDALEGGLEIEVRLGRKGHRRLAFLSGGEKALAGLGFLFALHLARPTPFLVLDEVDAPLDDANLTRFLRLLDSLRHQTQVIVVTHQKKTMERADSLVGVTLGPDGTSRVITQNVQAAVAAAERRPAEAR